MRFFGRLTHVFAPVMLPAATDVMPDIPVARPERSDSRGHLLPAVIEGYPRLSPLQPGAQEMTSVKL